MNGLNLERLLRLLRNDPAFWWSAGGAIAIIGLIVWAGRGRRRMLQRCLILSLGMHAGIVVYGGPQALRWLSDPSHSRGEPGGDPAAPRSLASRVRLIADSDESARRGRISKTDSGTRLSSSLDTFPDIPTPEPAARSRSPLPSVIPAPSPAVGTSDSLPRIELPTPLPAEEQPSTRSRELATKVAPAELDPTELLGSTRAAASVDDQPALPELAPELSRLANPTLPDLPIKPESPNLIPQVLVPELPAMAHEAATLTPARDPSREPIGPLSAEAGDRSSVLVQPTTSDDVPSLPEPDLRRPSANGAAARPIPPASAAIPPYLGVREPLELALPSPRSTPIDSSSLPGTETTTANRALPDIPEIYRSRFAPNRSALALDAGATPASEESVERALAWLARHQDDDGRWNAGARLGPGGRAAPGETSFLAHCPPSDPCHGDSYYFGADNAMTGLAILAFLGAGQTHTGPYTYAPNVKRGLDFLLSVQAVDGDLRGPFRGPGIYCHAIASLALTEAYAITGDERLRDPAQRALDFLVRARAADRLSWRYEPGDRYGGDTSILGWGVMVAKSAREAGLNVPADLRRGALGWLEKVADGSARGLAMYRPPGYSDGGRVTPTMTAEAWVCRQFLGVGGPGTASDEAARFLLAHGPDRDPLNLYYWYYATLALYQHGGPSWSRWNERVRDQLVGRQVRGGHADGSWDPAICKEEYDFRGGRIYTTAMATLTLEVYYRYLKLYDAPPSPAHFAPADSVLHRSATPAADPPR